MAQLLVGQTFLSYLPKKLMNSDPVFADLRPVPMLMLLASGSHRSAANRIAAGPAG